MNEFIITLFTISISGSFLFLFFRLFDYIWGKKYVIWQYAIMKGILLFFLLPAVIVPAIYLIKKQPEEVIMQGDDLTHWTLYEGNALYIAEKDWSKLTITLFIIWLIGFFIVFVRGIIKNMNSIREMSMLAKKVEDIEILQIKECIQKELNIRKNIDIYVTALATSPCITGLRRTKIFLPKISFSKEEMMNYIIIKKRTFFIIILLVFSGGFIGLIQ